MPPIPPHFLDCSLYLYASEDAAKAREAAGGSGFLVHVPSEHQGHAYQYAVTNKHVVDAGFQTMRINTKGGGFDVVSTVPESWTLASAGDDLAVAAIRDIGGRFKSYSVGTEDLVTEELVEQYRIGPGDEVFMIGRLIRFDGRQRNKPVVRFGNLSMMADPAEPVVVGTRRQEAFLVECRSLSGFSGSPVFIKTTERVYQKPNIPDRERVKPNPQLGRGWLWTAQDGLEEVSGTFGPWLLGIDCAHLPLWKSVYEVDKQTETHYRTDANTGIACVIPAWRILDLLNQDDLVKARKHEDAEFSKRLRNAAIPDEEGS